MTPSVLWPLDEHTRAKHQVLAGYLAAWLPIMGQQAMKVSGLRKDPPRLLIVDGFCGPGRYESGEDGSPLIMLKTLTEHEAFERMSEGGVKFLYLFIEQDERRIDHLNSELAELGIPENVEVMVEHGNFEETFGKIVDDIHGEEGVTLVPTFAFIDPFGYSFTPMSLAGKFLDFQRCEALFFLPMIDIVRFAGREGQENAMNSLFGTDRWKEAAKLEGEARRDFLLSLFEDQLREGGRVRFVCSFEIRTSKGRDYRLIFASDHERGLGLMKRAMWKVDPVEGVRYVAARKKDGQEVLFSSEVDTGPLLEHLREKFGTDWFTIEQAEKETLVNTPYLHDGHLKNKTLSPAKKAELIEVDFPPGRKGFVPGTRMRFYE